MNSAEIDTMYLVTNWMMADRPAKVLNIPCRDPDSAKACAAIIRERLKDIHISVGHHAVRVTRIAHKPPEIREGIPKSVQEHIRSVVQQWLEKPTGTKLKIPCVGGSWVDDIGYYLHGVFSDLISITIDKGDPIDMLCITDIRKPAETLNGHPLVYTDAAHYRLTVQGNTSFGSQWDTAVEVGRPVAITLTCPPSDITQIQMRIRTRPHALGGSQPLGRNTLGGIDAENIVLTPGASSAVWFITPHQLVDVDVVSFHGADTCPSIGIYLASW